MWILLFILKQEGQNWKKTHLKRSSFCQVHCIAQQVPERCGLPVTLVIHINNKAACLLMLCHDLETKEIVKSHINIGTKPTRTDISQAPKKLVWKLWAKEKLPSFPFSWGRQNQMHKTTLSTSRKDKCEDNLGFLSKTKTSNQSLAES